MTIKKAAAPSVAPSTLHRLLNAGIIPGEQLIPGAPWRIRLTPDIMARFNNEPGEGFMPMREAMKVLGVSRETVLQRVEAASSKPSLSCAASKKDSGSKR